MATWKQGKTVVKGSRPKVKCQCNSCGAWVPVDECTMQEVETWRRKYVVYECKACRLEAARELREIRREERQRDEEYWREG